MRYGFRLMVVISAVFLAWSFHESAVIVKIHLSIIIYNKFLILQGGAKLEGIKFNNSVRYGIRFFYMCKKYQFNHAH